MSSVTLNCSDPIFKSMHLFKQFEVDQEEDFVSTTFLLYYLYNVYFLQYDNGSCSKWSCSMFG